MLKKGTFVLSLDLELKWGSFDHGADLAKYGFDRTRHYVNELLRMLNRYKIPTTFAIVGHLFLNNCDTKKGIKHPEIIRANHTWYDQDWFSQDPSTDRAADPDWYGDDIVEKIRNASPEHEIASHSFSHAIFGDSGCSEEAAASEIKACVKLAEEWGIELKSFVFPRNKVGYLDILKEYGFTNYRGLDPTWFKFFKGKMFRIGYLLDFILMITPPCSDPILEKNGLVNIPGSQIYLSRLGFRKYIPMWMRTKKVKKGIDRAIKEGKIFHFWFHPFNLCIDGEKMMEGLEEIFKYVSKKREDGRLEVRTMDSIASTFLKKDAKVKIA
ncbi:MAG: polysaccharide deacetylase family protein [Candidatus Peregrinibacteria bacterium]|nr:polysaccharide deacetylase family protein [Candidatus Peregrinibacteria bacterium]